MANRRLFNKQIIYSASFERLPDRARILYQYLILEADDDGFVGNPIGVIRMAGATNEHYEMLKQEGFLIEFGSGVCLITHWLRHNSIARDGYVSTVFREEISQIKIRSTGEYELR